MTSVLPLPIEGGCLCGAIRYSFAAQPISARACWCRTCQYVAAGSATVNIRFPSEAMTLKGVVRWHESKADSGNDMARGFCPECGTPMFSKAAQRPHIIVVRAGTLDDPKLIPPQATIWTSEAPGWAPIDRRLPAEPRQPAG